MKPEMKPGMKSEKQRAVKVTRLGIRPMRYTLERRKAVAGLLFTLPFSIGFLMLFAYPIVQSVLFSLSEISIGPNGFVLEYVGLQHYREAFTVDPRFNRTFTESIWNMVLNVPLIIVFSFFIASILNQNFRGRAAARTIFFLPVIMASGIVMKMDDPQSVHNVLLHGGSNEGSIMNQAIQSFQLSRYLDQIGLSTGVIDYLVGAIDRIYQVINMTGVQILVLLAALQSIPRSLYEAAMIEGATGWEIFWKITFPMVSPYILTITVYSVIDNFTSYNNAMMRLIDTVTTKSFDYAYGTAMAWVYFIAVIAILAIVIPLLNRRVFYHE